MLPGRVADRNSRACCDVRHEADAATRSHAYGGVMADDEMSSSEVRQRLSWGVGIAIGMGVGVAMGSALDNMALGIAIGVAIGVVFAVALRAAGRPRPPRGGASGRPDAEGPDAGPDAETPDSGR